MLNDEKADNLLQQGLKVIRVAILEIERGSDRGQCQFGLCASVLCVVGPEFRALAKLVVNMQALV